MKTKLAVVSGIFIILTLIFGGSWITKRSATSQSLVVEPLGEKGIFVGDKKFSSADETERRRRLYPVQQKEWEEHRRKLQSIEVASNYIKEGNEYFKNADYEAAARAFNRAYLSDKGSRNLSGRFLVRAYEKMKRYDDGIKISNQMIQNKELNDLGIKLALVHIARLEALKAGRPVPEDKDPTNPVPNLDPSSYIFPDEK